MKTITLTKEQRHEVYKMALKMIKSRESAFICHAIYDSLIEIYDIRTTTSTYELFEEFNSLRPKNAPYAWFKLDDDGMKKRINVLRKCVKLTLPEPK